jgi:hypothetical protein
MRVACQRPGCSVSGKTVKSVANIGEVARHWYTYRMPDPPFYINMKAATPGCEKCQHLMWGAVAGLLDLLAKLKVIR